jgi:hypothetical protein
MIGPIGVQGPIGPAGPQGLTGSVRQIVVTWFPSIGGGYSAFAAVEAQPGMPVRITGAGFLPDQLVVITVCEQNRVLGVATANSCGAFQTFGLLPSDLVAGSMVSVKAWVDLNDNGILETANGEFQACWPLNIVSVFLPFP